ncbi:tRNA glutamyl-Q(34) synthetase GluQRS [Desulfovibrio sp. DS-1]|nr:tRNA glutamyl-Q(34) synthetase GluQRS [Nitratidesulfovibrio sp. SRB-5]RXF78716.1 tRNA glutamyl-Q(34) synthetase GluQRS [Desulfovibrio sp. DS-1]
MPLGCRPPSAASASSSRGQFVATPDRSRPVRGRLAPSPTGHIHLGNAASFLMAWLCARAAGGQMVLRMEDIDPDRSRPEFAADMVRDLLWLGLDWDEGPEFPAMLPDPQPDPRPDGASAPVSTPPLGLCAVPDHARMPGRGGPHGPYSQSERLALYADALARLEREGHVYPCFCTRKELRSLASAPHAGECGPAYPGTCRNLGPEDRARRLAEGRRPAMRVRCDDTAIAFTDHIAGPQRMSLAECGGDFAVRRSDGVFAYQLAVVVDDIAMGITQVVRGDDILASTPRQIWLYRLLGAPVPEYVHVPLLLDHEGERLAKRHGSLAVAALRSAGVSPWAIVGYLAWRLGLRDAPGLVTPRELAGTLDLARVVRQPVMLPEDVADVLRRMGQGATAR